MHIDLVLSEVSGAQRRLETVAGGLGDDEVRAPSALDGWTRGHVLTHLARNADSQTAMLEGARRREIVAQYPGGDEQRSGDIERGAGRSADEIVADLVAAHARFLTTAASLTSADWEQTTRPRAGERPAWASAWGRWREVEVHTVDLGLGADPGAPRLSPAFAAAFLPPELDRLPLRLPPALAGADPGDIVLDGEPGECLLWLMGRPADSVRLRVSGSTVARDELAPWVLTAWMPGRADDRPGPGST